MATSSHIWNNRPSQVTATNAQTLAAKLQDVVTKIAAPLGRTSSCTGPRLVHQECEWKHASLFQLSEEVAELQPQLHSRANRSMAADM